MAGNFRGHTFNALMQPRAVYDRPLTFRGAIAPLGTYQNPDGTEDVGFAWPGIITEPLKALQRLHENSYTEDGRLGMPNPEYQGNKDDALTALLSIYAGNALNPATRLPENALGMFAGRNAKTANLKALSRAEDMAGKGASREDIWNDTGWFQGPDQKWRFEIDDSGQRLLKMPDDLSKIDRPIASDMVFKHDALHEAYPAVADTPWYYTPNIDGGGASYDATRGIRVSSAPSLSYDTGGIGGVTLHEQQHAIQQIEDFARGGNREMGHKLDDVKREAQQAYEATARKQASGIRTADDELLAELGISEPVASKPWDGLSLREQLEWYDAGRGRVYNRLSGETEARNVQTRMNMSAEERRATPPWETQDVPDDQQIVRFLSDTGKPSLMGSAISSAGHDVPPLESALASHRLEGSQTPMLPQAAHQGGDLSGRMPDLSQSQPGQAPRSLIENDPYLKAWADDLGLDYDGLLSPAIAKAMADGEDFYYGIRTTPYQVNVGSIMPDSTQWYQDAMPVPFKDLTKSERRDVVEMVGHYLSDDEIKSRSWDPSYLDHGDPLGGASAREFIRPFQTPTTDSVSTARGYKQYGADGDFVHFVRSKTARDGLDRNEWIMPNAEVVAVAPYSKTLFSDTGKPSLTGSAISSAGHDVSGSGAVTKPKGITAYHGSPHDFNKFDLSKIGTGEGAQAYGHGLYFAENEGVANSYRRKLSQGYSDGIGMAREALMLTGGDFEKAIAHVLRGKDSYGKRWGNDPNRLPFGKLYDDAVRELRLKPEGLAPSGHMYQVRINADPNDFLDWDLPLSQQKNIKNALEKVGHGVFADSALFGSSVAPKPSEISKYVEAGIPGIKYLDGNSRAAGDGSRNYVVFDDSLIEILKKYGLAGGAIGAGSLFDFNTEQQY